MSRPLALLQQANSLAKVLVLTTYADDRSVLDALRAGARGYLTEDSGGAEIHAALRTGTASCPDPLPQHSTPPRRRIAPT